MSQQTKHTPGPWYQDVEEPTEEINGASFALTEKGFTKPIEILTGIYQRIVIRTAAPTHQFAGGVGYYVAETSFPLNLKDDLPVTCPEEMKANMCLITAAPDLLATCELAFKARCLHIQGDEYYMDERDEVAIALRTVIAKARGEALDG